MWPTYVATDINNAIVIDSMEAYYYSPVIFTDFFKGESCNPQFFEREGCNPCQFSWHGLLRLQGSRFIYHEHSWCLPWHPTRSKAVRDIVFRQAWPEQNHHHHDDIYSHIMPTFQGHSLCHSGCPHLGICTRHPEVSAQDTGTVRQRENLHIKSSTVTCTWMYTRTRSWSHMDLTKAHRHLPTPVCLFRHSH